MKVPFDQMGEMVRHGLAAAFKSRAPLILPYSWRVMESYDNACRYMRNDGLHVILEMELIRDGVKAGLYAPETPWLHLSVSYTEIHRMPTYDDLKVVKDLFLGTERMAIMVFPKKSEHFNCRQNCLHLYSPHTHEPLPDFRSPDGTL